MVFLFWHDKCACLHYGILLSWAALYHAVLVILNDEPYLGSHDMSKLGLTVLLSTDESNDHRRKALNQGDALMNSPRFARTWEHM